MKCPVCWSEKAYQRRTLELKDQVLSMFFMVPMRCHHCFHRFYISRLRAISEDIAAPERRHGSPIRKAA